MNTSRAQGRYSTTRRRFLLNMSAQYTRDASNHQTNTVAHKEYAVLSSERSHNSTWKTPWRGYREEYLNTVASDPYWPVEIVHCSRDSCDYWSLTGSWRCRCSWRNRGGWTRGHRRSRCRSRARPDAWWKEARAGADALCHWHLDGTAYLISSESASWEL